MADLVRAFDWGATPVGPIESWPASLRVAVTTLLECQIPMYIAWGEDLLQLYNDAYRPILGSDKHPRALGAPAHLTWPEIWETIGPMWREVMGGKPIGFKDYKFTILRDGRPEDAYFNFSYSPLRDDAGEVAGILVTFAETTDRVRNEKRLRQEQDKLRALFMQAPAGLAILRGSEMRFELANVPYQKLVGRSEAELIGRPVAEAFPELSPAIHSILERVFASGERFVASEFGLTLDWDANGRPYERYINFVYEPLREEDGNVDGVMVFTYDVSEQVAARQEAQEAQCRTRFAIDASRMGEWEMDLSSGMAKRSARHDQCFGYEHMLPSWSYQEFLDRVQPPHRATIDEQFQRAIAERGDCSFECPIIWPDKTLHWIASRARVVTDGAGKPLRISGLVWDITESRAAHDALREANRQKDEFLATLAHELRNPLAPIRNAAYALGRDALAPTDLAWCRDVITRQVKHMALLLDDLLDVSRITTGKVELKKEVVQLRTVVNAAIETVSPLLHSKQHALQVTLPQEPLEVEVDPLRLAQVFTNLLTNAAKYTDPGGCIELIAGADDHGVTATLRDNGIGVAPEALPHLFRMFSQIPSAVDRSEGGLGIGLALSKGLVELHGGSLSVHSEGHGHGATFELHLPPSAIRTADSTAHSPGAPQPPVAQRRSVLVVDDNRDAADTLAVFLELEGHEVSVAYGAEQALSIGASKPPDVAILDIGMPGMNGYELARRIRQETWGPSVFLVAATGWGHEDDRRKAASAGFDRHLTKPVNPNAIIAMLSEDGMG